MILTYDKFLSEKKNPCWKGYKQIGTKIKRGKKVPNCVRVNEGVDPLFDRPSFYLEYYKNLSPSDFDVELYGDSIVIKIQNSLT
jgi:hypothetical protein